MSDRGGAAGVDVSRETLEKLHALEGLVRKWTTKINLVAPSTLPDLWERHIVDSAQLFPLAATGWKTWVDLGSGAGFPGLVIACMADDAQNVTLVESDARKASFLLTATRELGLTCKVLVERAERLQISACDVVSARALAPLSGLLDLAAPFVHQGSVLLFPKGRNHAAELTQAQANWDFEVDRIQSITDPEARILRMTRIAKRES